MTPNLAAPDIPRATRGRPTQFVGWLVGERLLRSFVTAAVLAAVARHLQPSGFGVLNLALAAVGVAMPLAQFGLEYVLIRELVRYPAQAGALLGTSAVLRLGSGLVCFAALQAAALLPSLVVARSAIAIAGLLLLMQAGEVTDAWFRRHVQSRAAVLARSAALLVGAAVKLILIARDAGVLAFAAVQVLESLLFIVGLRWAYGRGPDAGPAWSWNATVAVRLWREGRGFALAALLGSLATRVDQFAVSTWLGEAAAGRYFAALRLIEVPFFIATTVAASLLPALAAAAGAPELRRSFAMMSLLGWATALGATITAPWVVPIFFGRDYAAATPVLVVHAWACLPLFAALVRGQWLAVHGASGVQLATSGIAVVSQALLAWWLVPRFGLIGAASTFLLTQLLGAIVVPLVFPALHACVPAQVQALFAPWRRSFWRELRGQTA